MKKRGENKENSAVPVAGKAEEDEVAKRGGKKSYKIA